MTGRLRLDEFTDPASLTIVCHDRQMTLTQADHETSGATLHTDRVVRQCSVCGAGLITSVLSARTGPDGA